MSNGTFILTASRIADIIDMRQVLRIAERTFGSHGAGKVQMPAKIYIHIHKYNGDFRAMPAYIETTEACGIKWVNVHPDNKKHGLPSVMAIIILSDPKTGRPLAIMDGTHITNLRTGAAGGIAAKYLANKNASTVGLVGCGVQGYSQLVALNEVRRLKHVSIYDADSKHAAGFIKRIKGLFIKTDISGTIKECVTGKDIVVTTTPSRRPIIKSEWISPGTHINAIGADAKGKEELDPAILRRARVFVDDRVQAMHSGEINVPLAKRLMRPSNICATLGEVICGYAKGRRSPDEITVFDSTGLAIQDIAVADYVYKTISSRRARPLSTSVAFMS